MLAIRSAPPPAYRRSERQKFFQDLPAASLQSRSALCKVIGMTNNENPFTPTITASGNLSHKTCSHPANARFRARCRYESAANRFAETAARNAASTDTSLHGAIDPDDIVIGTLN